MKYTIEVLKRDGNTDTHEASCSLRASRLINALLVSPQVSEIKVKILSGEIE